MSQVGRDPTATDCCRNSIVPGGDARTPATTTMESAEAAMRQRARHLALLLMATSAVAVVGGILLLFWRLA